MDNSLTKSDINKLKNISISSSNNNSNNSKSNSITSNTSNTSNISNTNNSSLCNINTEVNLDDEIIYKSCPPKITRQYAFSDSYNDLLNLNM